MKIVLDMNIPLNWVAFLESHGHTVKHWRDIGNIRAEDTEIMKWARDNQYSVFTHDLDFGSLLYSTNASKPSVIQLRTENIFPDESGYFIIETLDTLSNELKQGALAIIDPKKHRTRLLPLRNNHRKQLESE